MILNRCTSNIPINESSIAKIMYGENNEIKAGPFASASEINQKTSTSKDYSKRIPGVNYRSFGKPIDLGEKKRY